MAAGVALANAGHPSGRHPLLWQNLYRLALHFRRYGHLPAALPDEQERQPGRRQPTLAGLRDTVGEASAKVPTWVWIIVLLVFAFLYPLFTGRYAQDVATNVLIYICLGLGLNVVVGLAGMLDLGYIAFYGVGAYTYALLNIHFGMSFWVCLPIAATLAMIAGSLIGYPTLRMRGDYLAIVTLGFGEIVRIILNNWMSLTNGPNGILGINPPVFTFPALRTGSVWRFFT